MLPILDTNPRKPPKYRTTAVAATFAAGFHGIERDGEFLYQWMGSQGRLTFAPVDCLRYLELMVLSEWRDLSQQLRCTVGDTTDEPTELTLYHGWDRVSIPVPAGADHLDLSANKNFPREYYPDDPRELCLRVGEPVIHEDPLRHGRVSLQHENRLLNWREMRDGTSELTSFPQNLGIDLHGHCNVKPPCVYCEWDYYKDLEGKNVSASFSVDTLNEWGKFFDTPYMFQNCGIGEPFLHKHIDQLLDQIGDHGKLLEMSTNGQILSDENIQSLLGRNIHLYVSLDAATATTYKRLRNDTFDLILDNLRRLVAAKGGPGKLPLIYMVFMPMKVNAEEAIPFVELCANLQVDQMVLRHLFRDTSDDIKIQRAGYEYDYQNELLTFEKLTKVRSQVAEHCRKLGVSLADQMEFGEEYSAPVAEEPAESIELVEKPEEPSHPPLPELGSPPTTLCDEPWKSLYILRRGVMPCCYGREPLGDLTEYREIWNGPVLQDMRQKLSSGEFPQYCKNSGNCPIVQKAGAFTGKPESSPSPASDDSEAA